MNPLKKYKFVWLLLVTAPNWVTAHEGWPWGQVLAWHDDQIDQVSTWGRVGGAMVAGRNVSVERKDCLEGGDLHFKVNDAYAFDIDETVWLDVEYYLGTVGSKLHVVYDSAGLAGEGIEVALPQKTINLQWYRRSIRLERARFANLGFEGSDFSMVADGAQANFTLCKLSLRRSYTTPVNEVFGWADIDIFDERDQPTPTRMGIYDASGRLPLPSDEALSFKNTRTGASRVIALWPGTLLWPVKNRSAFYVDGHYHARLPTGDYELIIAKGPEYRLSRRRFTVLAKHTNTIRIKLNRWTDMAARGWYSGDDHMHYPRASEYDDHILQLLTRAEDLNVANILQYGNSDDVYLSPYDWKPVSRDPGAHYVLVPGQEDPRTSLLGHTAELNIAKSIRDPAHYLLYDHVFESVHAQGGLAGYAHVMGQSEDPFLDPRGMAIDVPLGLVDFAEIMMPQVTGTSPWFSFLNLGYKLPPTAGTDWGVGGIPGAVRNYVQIGEPFTPQAWFDGLKQGRTFVTSGPVLEISVNGQGMGSEIRVKSGEALVINAKASLNPDIDALSSVELIEQGEVVKEVLSQSGTQKMELRHEIAAKHGTWFVLRARGKNPDVIAVSGPIYVWVDGQSFWKRSQVAPIVATMKMKMQEIFKPNQVEPTWEGQSPDVFAKYWDAQKTALKKRVDRANSIYDDLVRRAASSHD